jgi:hypothetical protein
MKQNNIKIRVIFNLCCFYFHTQIHTLRVVHRLFCVLAVKSYIRKSKKLNGLRFVQNVLNISRSFQRFFSECFGSKNHMHLGLVARLDFGGNSGGGGKNLGEVQQCSSRPPWKVRA